MDFFSGSFPLEFISFYLDMASEENNEIAPATTTEALMEEEVLRQSEETVTSQSALTPEDSGSKRPNSPKDDPAKPDPIPSSSTDESISGYIERQLRTLGCQGTRLDVSFLPPTSTAIVNNAPESMTDKVSESEPILQVTPGPEDKESPEIEVEQAADIASEAGFSVTKAD